MTTYERIAGLELEVDGYDLERREQEVSGGFTRVTTTVVLRGGGHEGRGEDVTYLPEDHEPYPRLEVAGRSTLDDFSRRLDGEELFPRTPKWAASSEYRRWAFESAGLDLALRQAGLSLGEALGREHRPVRFVVSTRLDIGGWLALDPELEFKLDPTSDWDRPLMEEIAASDRVRVLDFKAYYVGTVVEQTPDPELYRSCLELFPGAIIEDAALTDETREVLRGAEDRLSWDAPIHSVADAEALPIPPRFLNIKPSRFGSLRRLFECLDWCAERGVSTYAGGQFELGPGRGQIQSLASLFSPDAPNDCAPTEYNGPGPVAGLPRSPLEPRPEPIGFAWRTP